MKNFKTSIISVFCSMLNKIELYLIFLLKSLKSKVVKYSRRQYKGPDFSRFQGFTKFVDRVLLFPYHLLYWIYVAPIVYIYLKIYKIAYKLFRKRNWFKRLFQIYQNLQQVYEALKMKFLAMEIVELFIFCIGASLEILLTLVWPFQSKLPEEKTISLHELSELVAYEELEQDVNMTEAPAAFRRSVRSMHHYVPLNPFKATVRVYKAPVPENYREELLEYDSSIVADTVGADSPASFPPTPFSRAYVMNRASERVVSLMFAARDRLRLEAQSVSRDEYSRMIAAEARTSGQYAVFDSRQTSSGIALTCGNHCAVKTGKGLCCSCRSMVAIHPNTFVYLELSITVSNAQTPTLGIGLSSPDCPLNVMVGSWPQSIGLYNDGQILVDSHWYQTNSHQKIEAGSTVGMLVFIPKDSSTLVSGTDDNTSLGLQQPEVVHPQSSAMISDDSNESKLILDISNPQPEIPSKAMVAFNINGEPLSCSPEALAVVEKFHASNSPLFPTVSLFSEDTRVWCRFCEADIVYRTRDCIKAPLGSRVYCLDGSLLLDEYQ